MSGLYIVQVAICICFMDGFDGQPLYEDKCHVDEMDRRFNGAYNREVVLQRQIGRLKNQLDSFRETIERLQFHLGCLDENGTYLEENVTKSQYCFIKAPFNWKNAKGKCQSFGSHLLEINTESEQKWLYDKGTGNSFELGRNVVDRTCITHRRTLMDLGSFGECIDIKILASSRTQW
ncbi:uncharacterized protein [Magallana gigas]|uniref:uncharacterized protein isoform X2 n=1 Tax=Magallana gigas TaxID=29159 RepID=UPI0033414737